MYKFTSLSKTWLLGIVLFGWIVGFIVWLYHIYHIPQPSHKTSTIVVLTGGQERIKKGVSLLDRNPEASFLISGVYTIKYLNEINKYADYARQIDLGFEATTTEENALEVKKWLRNKKTKKLYVVTSHYHMDRSLLELEYAMPTIHFVAYPVISHQFRELRWISRPRNLHLLFKEYNKFLIVYVEILFKRLFHAMRASI